MQSVLEGNNIPETSLRNETGDEIALTSDMAGLVVDMDGYRLMPFYTALHGVILFSSATDSAGF